MPSQPATPKNLARERHIFCGQVQGVGFRPFIYGMAIEQELTGFVKNTADGVVVEVQGEPENLACFASAVTRSLPPLACLNGHERQALPTVAMEKVFSILTSDAGAGHAVLISPDMATCAKCEEECLHPADRRFGYSFTNCTNCGPRYTITRSIPYDRATTSMACFSLCPACRHEYENPLDRRFHAQPNACPVCGPQLWFALAGDDVAPPAAKDNIARSLQQDPLKKLAQFLATGGIAAVKGLGGFHLACLAVSDSAVAQLRLAKNRPHKPFAVMVPDVETAKRVARVGAAEEALLSSRQRPVVLCSGIEGALSPLVSPDTGLTGIMLPYTPLHRLLFLALANTVAASGSAPLALVMTSGNRGGEPICLGNREAVKSLSGIAGAFCLHDRDILIRVDDSVVRPIALGGTAIVQYLRRARGYVPTPLPLPPCKDTADPKDREAAGQGGSAPVILACGADLKNTLCITKGEEAFVSQHIGDMENMETMHFHKEIAEHLPGLLQVQPDIVVRDAHPNFLSGAVAEEYGLPVYSLEHHKAHAFAVLGENPHIPEALCLTLDGTGMGEDGALWGGEAIVANTRTGISFRAGSFVPFLLPGGEAAIRNPWRIAHALCLSLGLETARMSQMPWMPTRATTADLVAQMVERGLNSPPTSSCGRLFDAVAALLGLCLETSYEGQAAIRLENAQTAEQGIQPFDLPGLVYEAFASPEQQFPLVLLNAPLLFRAVAEGREAGESVPVLARRFHCTLAAGLAEQAAIICARHGLGAVGLAGGCFCNTSLLGDLWACLVQKGLEPFTHHHLPPGDGSIAFGQAVWARARLSEGSSRMKP